MLVVVADQVLQRKTVMGGDEIDARPSSPATVTEDIGRARYARSEVRDETLVAFPKAPDGVPILSIPLGPAGWKIAELIPVGTEIPGLGNELERGHHGVLPDGVEKRTALPIIAVLSGEGRA